MADMILGVHSSADGSDGLTAGHAWLTITENGVTTFYGLWPDSHPNIVDNGNGTDIRVGKEAGTTAAANRYYKLYPAQATQFKALMSANVTWRMTNNCSSWASDVVATVIGEDVDADDTAFVETPRELGRNIQLLEAADPTSLISPKAVTKNPAGP